MPGSRLAGLLAALGLALALLGCGLSEGPDGPSGGDSGSQALRDLEGLAFLPASEFLIATEFALAVDAPMLLDRYEVTRAQWKRFLREAEFEVDPIFAEHLQTWEPGTGSWPAGFMTLPEAERFAAWRGMRLPTASEWLSAAVGPNDWSYPWGTTPRQSLANTLELGLGRPTPVGTFESGRSPHFCYDLHGNVFEWVVGPVPTRLKVPPGYDGAAALGGSFRTASAATYLLDLDPRPGGRNDHVGLRCAADAATYLWDNAEAWGLDGDARARLGAVGERFGRQALPLLIELAARPGAPEGLGVLLEGARR